eukprot:scaffold5190_cov113-Isochrysis_galbana.AAC.6
MPVRASGATQPTGNSQLPGLTTPEGRPSRGHHREEAPPGPHRRASAWPTPMPPAIPQPAWHPGAARAAAQGAQRQGKAAPARRDEPRPTASLHNPAA